MRVFDKGKGNKDRFTLFIDDEVNRFFECLILSENCDSPDGFEMVDSYHFKHIASGHQGKEIKFIDLPDNVQAYVKKHGFFDGYFFRDDSILSLT